MTDTVVAVHGGPWGDALLAGLEQLVPEASFVPADSAKAVGAEVLATVADDAAALARALRPGIAWVHVLGAGVDGFPFELVEGRLLSCSRGASAPAIAEFVLAAMLAFEKRLPESWVTSPPARWNVADLGGLAGRRLGLVGIGAIGCEVARRALAFDMEVSAVRRHPGPSPAPGVELASSLPVLVASSDHVVVAAPATADTFHLFDKTLFSAMKPGAHLVNVARGSLIDQEALLEALDLGSLSMATLDVVEPEPLAAGHPLFSHPRVRLSPHISWSSPDTGRRTFELFAANLARFRIGQPLAGVVDPGRGY